MDGDVTDLALDALLERLGQGGLVKAGGAGAHRFHPCAGRDPVVKPVGAGRGNPAGWARALAVAAPDWLTEVIDGSWQDVYGARIDNLRLPESATKREKLMVQFGRDGYHLLDQIYGPGAPGWLRELPAVQAVRRIWIQQVYRDVEGDRQEVRRRENAPVGDGLPPGRDRLISPDDLDARYSVKRDHGWGGYQVHFTPDLQPAGSGHGHGQRCGHRGRTRPGATWRI